ncbi:LD-carboxypeptidase [Xenorhabdus entomophaga]|uniref:LD-carboxypeptidase n=1 Tax=Xenorhabdus entomophaga TaxID=3136257 RepID=UPI003BF48FB7
MLNTYKINFKPKTEILTGKSVFYRQKSILRIVTGFNSLILAKAVRYIMPTIGNYNSNSMLPYIDYNVIKN